MNEINSQEVECNVCKKHLQFSSAIYDDPLHKRGSFWYKQQFYCRECYYKKEMKIVLIACTSFFSAILFFCLFGEFGLINGYVGHDAIGPIFGFMCFFDILIIISSYINMCENDKESPFEKRD